MDTLKANYKTVEDIDLFVGGMLENKLPSAKFGPTFACIVGEQFYRYKYGDRFWYEVEGQPHSFSPSKNLYLHLNQNIFLNNNFHSPIRRNS